MAVEKNNFKASRFDSEFSPVNNMYSDEDDEEERSARVALESDEADDGDEAEDRDEPEDEEDEEEDDDEFNDADSGAGSDDFDLLELGDSGAEFCQVGNVTCSIPFELYDLPGLEDVLSLDVWNEVLTEEEKFGLAKFLPDMDQLTYMRTLKELFEGDNFHFGSPMKKLFETLKGGVCEPRVALYREGLSSFQKRQHYHLLRNHHNTMISNLCQTRDAWLSCKGYSIEEKLRVLKIMKSQKSLMHETVEEDLESDSLEKGELGNGMRGKRVKGRRSAQKLGRSSAYWGGPDLDFATPMPLVGKEVTKHGKQIPKGILKMAGPKAASAMESMDRFPYQGMDINSRLYGSAVSLPRQSKAMGYGQGIRQRGKMRVDYDDDEADALDAIYGMGYPGNQNLVHRGFAKAGKKHDSLRNEALVADGFMSLPFSSKNEFSNAYGRNRATNQLSEMKTFAARSSSLQNEFEKRAKYPETIQQFAVGNSLKSLKGRAAQSPVTNNRFSLSEYSEPTSHGKSQAQAFPLEPSIKHDNWNISIKKLKKGKESPDFNFQNYRASSPQVNDAILLSELRTKPLNEKRAKVVQNGGSNKGAMRTMYQKNDETESDSSEYFDHDDDDDDDDDDYDNPSMKRKSSYASSMADGSRLSSFKSGIDTKKVKSVKKNMQETEMAFNGITHVPKKVDSFNELVHIAGFSSKVKMKGPPQTSSALPGSPFGVLDNNSPFSIGKLQDVDDRRRTRKVGKNGQFRAETVRSVPVPSLKAHSFDRKHKGEFNHYDAVADEFLHETHFRVDENTPGRTVKKGHKTEAFIHDRRDRSEASLQGCSSVTKKRKAKEEPVVEVDGGDEGGNEQSNLQQQIDESSSLKKKGKRKLDPDNADMDTSQHSATEAGTPAPVVEPEAKPQKKPYTPITPTVHTGFSFSIIHLLSAVRMAMITPLSELSLGVGKSKDELNRKLEDGSDDVIPHENADVSNKSDNASQASEPALSVPEIVNRVRSNPGDPCILETQEPLQDLIRGVLKIFSSKTAPLGAKAWKPLVGYEKSNKSWSWIGPISQTSTDHETNEEVTSPEYWGIPHKMLVKLVDSFANWLKCGQETLQQIGSLPAPPLSLMQCNLDEKERFRDLRAQKSLNTISPSPEEVRDYFRKEEVLRYSIPDRAFLYTAADGKKSIVAPLRRCGGKPTSKARDHFMLKRDRPPHVTILCLVRDAAARLPGSIGTRADVCTLIRDSQYIVEDVSDAQVNQVVSGALDRLHYERDPCVQFDGERKLWVYLHREREEEDFEDDGTSSTKKWKRQKKDPADQSDQGTVTVAFHGTEDQPGFDLGSDLNIEPPSTEGYKTNDNPEVGLEAATLVQDNMRQSVEDKVDNSQKLDHGNTDQGDPIAWEALNLNPTTENKLLCQENSTNEDFGDETFGREGPVELLSASLS